MADEKKAAVVADVKKKAAAARDAAMAKGHQEYAELFAALAGESLERSKPAKIQAAQ